MIFVRSKKPPFRTLAMSGSEVFLSLRLLTDTSMLFENKGPRHKRRRKQFPA
jgi:hypothetical protein